MIVLFDLDGVITDTEPQYKIFWDKIGLDYLGIEDFQFKIKGQALFQIYDGHFSGMLAEQEEITAELNEFELNMTYDYVPGVYEFMQNLKAAGVPMAIVTSSNEAKMANVRKAHPELWEIADVILTSEHFTKSKPDPECFLKGMSALGGKPGETYVFEDSIHGINAARAAGAHVIGLATTLAHETIEPLCEMVIKNFIGFTIDTIPYIENFS